LAANLGLTGGAGSAAFTCLESEGAGFSAAEGPPLPPRPPPQPRVRTLNAAAAAVFERVVGGMALVEHSDDE
jgi:hypothetical protein